MREMNLLRVGTSGPLVRRLLVGSAGSVDRCLTTTVSGRLGPAVPNFGIDRRAPDL
jgi:hypothetical protein